MKKIGRVNMKKEKDTIYINGRFLTQKITGVQRYAIEVVKQLDKLKSNYKFIILAPKKGLIHNLELNNIKIIKIGNLTGHAWEQISLPIYIFTHKEKTLLSLCNMAPILYPGYITLHDISFKTNSKHLNRKFVFWYKVITRLNIKRYKHIFTDSYFSKKEIIDNYNILDNKITVTYAAAEHFKNILPDDTIISKLDIKDKEYYFSLGSKSPHKNHEFIVECAKNNPDMLFVVSGNNNSKVFKNEIYNEDIGNLIYTGYISDNELVSLYKNCKAFIFPSLYEGFGMPPLEAITSGCKQIVLSEIPVLKEIYGKNAIYLDIKNKRSINLKDILNKKNENNIQHLTEKYKWENVANVIAKEIGG